MRALLNALDKNLHQNFEKPPQSLGSRTLLQRITLIAGLIERLQPDLKELPHLVQQAEGKVRNVAPDLQAELESLYKQVRDGFAPLAFLYDLRLHGGLAHPPSKEEAAEAATRLGLPRKNWHRTDYLHLLKLVAESFNRISEHFESVVESLA